MELRNYPQQENIRYYEIEAIEIPIVYNQYGDHDPNGLLYVLKEDAQRIREGAIRNFSQEVPQPYEEVQPLVIRANVGERIVVHFTHLWTVRCRFMCRGSPMMCRLRMGRMWDITGIQRHKSGLPIHGMHSVKGCICSMIWGI